MTIEERIKEWLYNHGMFEDQADAVVKAMKTDEANVAMVNRWGDDVEDYLDSLMVVLLVAAKHAALEYIDANCPRAWFRPMFVD